MQDLTEKLYNIFQEIDYLNQDGVIFSPSDIKTIKQVANGLLAIINDPLTRIKK